jgi:uncharacterized protein YgiM (DUF1202 family)
MKKAKMLSKLKKMTGPTRLPVEEKPVLMKGQIAANVLNIRAKASTDSDVVGKLKKNDIVEIIGIGEQWYEIHHNDGNAFVFAKFVEPLLKTGRVNANKLNIRSLPNLDAEKIGLLTADKKIIIVDEIDGWYKNKI